MPLLEPHTYVQSWYPLCRSAALGAGVVTRLEAFGTRWVLFRDAQGRPCALHAVCRHMGADLGAGCVEEGRVRCPYHGWAFGRSGACERIPAAEAIPKAAKQYALTCEEVGGLVFGFLGPSPYFPLPRPRGFSPSLVSSVKTVEIGAPVEVASINLFDLQHLEMIHHREVIGAPDVEIEGAFTHVHIRAKVMGDTFHDRALRAFGVHEAGINADCWGGNLFYFYYPKWRLCAQMSFLPLGPMRCRGFLSVMSSDSSGRGRLGQAWDRLLIELHTRWILLFLREDFLVTQGCTFDVKALLPSADAMVRRWIADYVRLPSEDLKHLVAATALISPRRGS
jgi:nitrite reductase/ring-hydroxylating ferredoxin subunit